MKQQRPNESIRPSLVSRIVALSALVLLLLLLWFYIVPTGLASAWYFKANHYLTLWIQDEALFSEESAQQAVDAIDHAVTLAPDNPHYLLTKAKLNEWLWYKGLMTTEQLDASEQLYLQAIAMRPTWPNAHADYAYFLGVTQFRVTEAFEQLALAHRYGPYLPEILLRQIGVGFTQWRYLTSEQKLDTLSALKYAVVSDWDTYHEALRLSRDSGMYRVSCSYLRASKAEFTEDQQTKILAQFCKAPSN
ncbi:hypothetical protein [Shewanella sp.]|uniref:hypothetical protein n=1 Tax=Shewanella sp. TaxID=50422 RepID=UPI003A9854BB